MIMIAVIGMLIGMFITYKTEPASFVSLAGMTIATLSYAVLLIVSLKYDKKRRLR
jgi:hypothetical protein